MKRSDKRTRFLHSAARLAIGLPGVLAAIPAAGQTTATTISPLTVEADHNGVNIATGQARIDVPTLSIPAAPRLSFDLLQNAMPHLIANISGAEADYKQSSIAVSHGGAASESFDCRAGLPCRNLKMNGAAVEGDEVNGGPYTFTQSATGAVYAFNSLEYDNGPTQQSRKVQYYATSIAYPDGEVISLTYDKVLGNGKTMHRLTRISSNIGYYIVISYGSNDGSQLAWRYLSQATLYKSDAPSSPLGQLTYNTDSTIRDLAGRTFACVGCVNAAGAQTEWSTASVTLPEEGGAHKSVTGSALIPGNIVLPQVVTSIVQDGVGWSYSYGNARTASSPLRYTYDNVVVSGPNGYSQRYNVVVKTIGSEPRANVISSIVDSNSRTTSYSYDGNLRPTLVTRPELDSVQIGYDGYGNITSKVSRPKPGSSLAAVTESAAIDGAGCGQTRVLCFRPTSYTDGLSRTTNYAYDGGGRLIQETSPADDAGVRSVKYLSYGSSFTSPTLIRLCGLGTTCGTNAEIRTEFTYLGQTALPVTETRVDGLTGARLTTTNAYDNAGRLLSSDGPLPGTDDAVYFRYDILGRKIWEIGPRGASGLRTAKRHTYRAADDKLIATETGTVTEPASTTLTAINRADVSYDSRRNPSRQVLSASGTTYSVVDRSFDDRSQLTCEAQRMNPAAFSAAPGACVLGAQGSFGPDRITRNSYDATGQLLKVEKAVDTPLRQDYATYNYSPNGRRTSVADANGNLASMTYDGFDRQVRWNLPSPGTRGAISATDYEAYGYDAVGNRTSLRKRDGVTIGYQYDALNRVTLKSVPGSASGGAGYSVYYGYDVRGLQTYARFGSSSGAGVANAYDGLGRLTSSTTTMGGVSRTLSYLYDGASNRARIAHPDGAHFNTRHDAAGQITYADWNGVTPFLSVTYDGLGRRTDINRASSFTGYKWDLSSRLLNQDQRFAGGTGNTSSAFSYNPGGQMVSRTRSNDDFAFGGYVNLSRSYAVNGLNQYTSAGPAAFGYDANGNLTSDGSTGFVYDAENRLVQASGARSASLAYDPLGRLWQTSGPAGTTQFLYDGDQLAAEYNGSGTLTRRYMFAGQDEPILVDEGGTLNCSGTRFLHTDHQGSIIAQADCWGNRTAVNTYDEYGIPGSSNQGRFQYTGQAWIPDLGMYYYKARVYSPTLGRFLQTDPIGYDDQVNLYAYAGNDPINRLDPTGLDSCDTVDPDGTSGGRMKNCIGDPEGPSTPTEEANTIGEEVTVTGRRIKDEDSVDAGRVRTGIVSLSGEIGFTREAGGLRSTALEPVCTRGATQAFKFPSGFLNGSEPYAGHTHNRDQESGVGPHDAAAALSHRSGIAVQADASGVRALAKLSTGSAVAVSNNGNWGDTGRAATARAVLALARATKGGKGNAASVSSPCR